MLVHIIIANENTECSLCFRCESSEGEIGDMIITFHRHDVCMNQPAPLPPTLVLLISLRSPISFHAKKIHIILLIDPIPLELLTPFILPIPSSAA